MLFCSTRDQQNQKTAHEVILEGIASDGGLFVPMQIPQIDVKTLCGMDYTQRAKTIFSAYLDDFTDEELEQVVRGAYAEGRFATADVEQIHSLTDRLFVMELFHGPTMAFKDVALQAMPRLLPLASVKSKNENEILILVATSGDTGKAALEGFCDVAGTRIIVFYPKDGVSRAQYLQMATQKGANTHVVAVEGNFDDCQTGVKKLFGDRAFNETLDSLGVSLSSANSINWARLMPQIVYYYSTYADLLNEGKICEGEPVHYVVPTGNFGDILAAEFARLMGLPVGKLICASNSNDVLVDFFEKGVYDSDRTFYRTISPSMDILVSSNLERLLYLRTKDAQWVRSRMGELSGGKRYDSAELFERIREGFWAQKCTEEETSRTIRKVWDRYGYVIDPHTAVGAGVYEKYKDAFPDDDTVTVIVSTASPYKFTDAVLEALGEKPQEDIFAQADQLARKTGTQIPGPLAALREAKIVHTTVCAKDRMGEAVLNIIKG
ncbi:MAG: threonine synthase [Clostridia bacterium]|nr:threonine synthase [Clostridia bacterium]